MNFFNEPYDVQIILGLTLVGVPKSWDEITLVGFIKSYAYAFGPNEVCIVSTFLESPNYEIRRAHITCNNLYSKQKLLKIRLIPVIDGEDDKRCQIITVRPYCFWMQYDPQSSPIPYMLPKYGSKDISYEIVESKMLLHRNNIHPSIVTCLMEFNLIPKDGSRWRASDAIAIWLSLKENNETLFNFLEGLLTKVQLTASTFKPYPYTIDDRLIYASSWNQLLILDKSNPENFLWPWESFNTLSSVQPSKKHVPKRGNDFNKLSCLAKKRNKKIGCIRYEVTRKRWVVDLSIDGKRLQKCFHETYYGLVGGLAEAIKWRFEFLKLSKKAFSPPSELKIISDVIEKIMQMNVDDYQKKELIDVLRKLPDGFEEICDRSQVERIIDSKTKEFRQDDGDDDYVKF